MIITHQTINLLKNVLGIFHFFHGGQLTGRCYHLNHFPQSAAESVSPPNHLESGSQFANGRVYNFISLRFRVEYNK